MASKEILDSLPYYDLDIENAHIKALVDAEIARELKKVQRVPQDDRVPGDVELFKNNKFLADEMIRVQSKQPLAVLDTVRYTLPVPSDPGASEDEWTHALDNARSQLEHQSSRQANLSLLQTYGANAWKVHNYVLESDVVAMEKELERLKDRVTDVNRERKNNQIRVGKTLTELETRWTQLVSTVIQLELANEALEAEVEQLRQQELALEG